MGSIDLPIPSADSAPASAPAPVPVPDPASSWIDAADHLWWSQIPEDLPAERARRALDQEFSQWSREQEARVAGEPEPPPRELQEMQLAWVTLAEDREPKLTDPALADLTPSELTTWLAEIEARHPDDVAVRFLARRRHRLALVRRWRNTDPAFITRSRAFEERMQERAACLFVNHPMCRPGVLVELMAPSVSTGAISSIERRVLGGEVWTGPSQMDDANVDPHARVLRYLDLIGDAYRALICEGHRS